MHPALITDELLRCRYCNRRFFGENELFFHMQQAHEQCHLCKRAQPDKFVYYRDYDELEGESVIDDPTTCAPCKR